MMHTMNRFFQTMFSETVERYMFHDQHNSGSSNQSEMQNMGIAAPPFAGTYEANFPLQALQDIPKFTTWSV